MENIENVWEKMGNYGAMSLNRWEEMEPSGPVEGGMDSWFRVTGGKTVSYMSVDAEK